MSAYLSGPIAPAITVAAVDGDRMLLDGLRAWLAAVPAVDLVAAVPTAAELLERTPAGVDVVLLDLLPTDRPAPPDDLARLVAAGHRVLVISAYATPARLAATLAAGARGYLTKDHDLADLVAAVREVAATGTSFSPELAAACLRDARPDRPELGPTQRAVLAELAAGRSPAAAAGSLTLTPDDVRAALGQVAARYHRAGTRHPGLLAVLSSREREVALLIRDGMTNAQIARRLGVTTKTVEKHASSTMAKLGVASRAGVAVRIGEDAWNG